MMLANWYFYCTTSMLVHARFLYEILLWKPLKHVSLFISIDTLFLLHENYFLLLHMRNNAKRHLQWTHDWKNTPKWKTTWSIPQKTTAVICIPLDSKCTYFSLLLHFFYISFFGCISGIALCNIRCSVYCSNYILLNYSQYQNGTK